MQISHKIELNPNNKQCTYFKKACGVARFTWNWALAEWERQYQLSKSNAHLPKPNAFKLKKQFNALKKQAFPWMYEVTKYASQQPFIHLQRAYREFLKKNRHKPKFKKRGRCRDSFYIGGDQIQTVGKKIKIPNLGWVRLKEPLRYGGNINGVTINRSADRWFVSFRVAVEVSMIPCKNQAGIGVDLGILRLATLSTGEKIENARPLAVKLQRLKRYQRTLSNRKQKGSKNYARQKNKIAALHKRIRDKRHNDLHQLTSYLTKNYQRIVIEDLHVQGMMKNHKLSRHIADVGFYEFRRQIEYKSSWYGNHLKIANRWFASSKTCSDCGEINESLLLSERDFACKNCHYKEDRDVNAARNLFNLLNTESSSGINALGQDGNVLTQLSENNQLGRTRNTASSL